MKQTDSSCNALLVDDHPILLEGLKTILREFQIYEGIFSVGTLKDAKRKLQDHPVSLVCLDISLPDGLGFDLIPVVRIHNPQAKIVIFSQFVETPYFKQAMDLGVDGFLLKNYETSQVQNALFEVLAGKSHFPSKAVAADIALDERLFELSRQERRVLYQLLNGRKVGEIATDMNINIKTVSTYKTRIFNKFGVKNLMQLYKMGKSLGLEREQRL